MVKFQVKDLQDTLAPFKSICTQRSFGGGVDNKLCITSSGLQARTPSASMDMKIIITPTETPVSVDFLLLYNLVRSLPPDDMVEVSLTENELKWATEDAKGRLAIQPADGFPALLHVPSEHALSSADFGSNIFELGALSCGDQFLTALAGVVIRRTEDALWCISSDGVSLSAAFFPRPPSEAPTAVITISPSGAALLSELCKFGGLLSLSTDGVRYYDAVIRDYEAVIRAIVHPIAELKHDIYGLAMSELAQIGDEAGIKLPKDRVEAFVKRAVALSEWKAKGLVTVQASENQLMVSFDEEIASGEEVYLIEGVSLGGLQPVRVATEARRLAVALAHCDELVLSSLKRGRMTFKSADSRFTHILATRAV